MLQESEKKLHNFLKVSKDVVYQLNLKKMKYDYISLSSREVLGYSPEEIMALGFAKLSSLVHPENREKMTEYFRKLKVQTGEYTAQTIEYRFKHKKTGYRWISDTCSVISDKKSIPVIAIGIIRDITERRQMEGMLRKERDNLINILETVENGLYIANQQYDIEYVNSAFQKEFGRFKGKKCYEYFHNRKSVCPHCKNKIIFTGKTICWEWFCSRNRKTYDIIATPLKNFNSGVSKLVIFHDITGRKKAENELTEVNTLLKSILNSSSQVSIISTDLEGNVLFWNKGAEKILGYKAEEVIGRRKIDILYEDRDTKRKIKEFRARVRKDIKEDNFEVKEVTKDGREIWMNLNVTVIEDKKGNRVGLLGIGEDITERKKAEEQIKRQRGQLSKFSGRLLSAREEEKKKLAVNLHDEVGAMVVALSFSLKSVEQKINRGAGKDAIEDIKKTRKMLLDSVGKLKAMAIHLRPPNLDLIGLPKAMREYISDIRLCTNARIEFTESLGGVKLNEGAAIALYRITQEALNNILKHAHAKNVKIKLDCRKGDIIYKITDDGAGFDMKKFENAEELKMGISGMRERAISLNGQFLIESKPGKGTRITVAIPVPKNGKQ